MNSEKGIVSRVMVAASFGQFEQLLRRHDWRYNWSDDYSVVVAGRRSFATILEMAKELVKIDARRTVALYNRYGKLGLGSDFMEADEKSFG